VAAQLAASGIEVELVPITTRGDAAAHDTISSLGAPGAFTKELERALIDGRIDLAVHSLKDLPTDEVPQLVLAAVPQRASPHDALISRHGSLEELPERAVIGTGSLRRRAQLLHARRDLQTRDIRGNVDTRLQKLAEGQYDALVLARAGLARLGLEDRITQTFREDVMMPAVGQGALAIETRLDDEVSRSAAGRLDHAATHCAVRAERALLAALAGGCLAPIGAWARASGEGRLRLDAVVLAADGSRRLAAHAEALDAEATALGTDVARMLIAQGARELIEQSRQRH
jgi:hydroxymethylbilane synthase